MNKKIEKPRKRRQLQGVVTSTKMTKTITVLLTVVKTHPIYKKAIRETKKYLVHDEKQLAKQGDIVVIEECRPLSAHKRFRLVNVVSSPTKIKTTKTKATADKKKHVTASKKTTKKTIKKTAKKVAVKKVKKTK